MSPFFFTISCIRQTNIFLLSIFLPIIAVYVNADNLHEYSHQHLSNRNLEDNATNCEFPDDGFNYSLCEVFDTCWIADGICHMNINGYISSECNYDGGDCEPCEFPDDGFDYESCDVMIPCWIGNGKCDSDYSQIYGSEQCNFDGGDCGFLDRLFDNWFFGNIIIPILLAPFQPFILLYIILMNPYD